MKKAIIIMILMLSIILISGCVDKSSEEEPTEAQPTIKDATANEIFGDFKVLCPTTNYIDEDGFLHISGEIENIGDLSKHDITVVFKFYDKEGRHATHSVQDVTTIVNPGEKYTFNYPKDVRSSLSPETVKTLDHYEIIRIDSYNVTN